jgi:hypothetical protein
MALASEDRSSVVDGLVAAHMSECAACREFELELRENSQALRAFGMESVPALPKVAFAVTPRRQQIGWRAGVAAVLVLGFASAWIAIRTPIGRAPHVPIAAAPQQIASVAALESRTEPRSEPAPPHVVSDRAPAQFRKGASPMRGHAPSRSQQNHESRILQIKMLTDDPDVVIYWQIEN